MALRFRDRQVYRADEKESHSLLKDEERKRLIERYVPEPLDEDADAPKAWQEEEKKKKSAAAAAAAAAATTPDKISRLGLRRFLRNQLHLLVFAILHSIFSLYLKVRKTSRTVRYRISSILFYHHRTPELIEKDVSTLGRKPKHLSVILSMEQDGRAAELERLVNEAADIAVWSACAGIPMLSVYERSGLLKRYLPQIHQTILQRFASYFGEDSPGLTVTAPHAESIESTPISTGGDARHLKVVFISYKDGRDSVVDLTKTLAEMSQRGKLSPSDIQIDLVDAELSEGIMSEPDMLLVFSPYVQLAGYPPWQIHLTEIFHLPDNYGVGYQVFIRGLRRYATAQMRRGK